MEILNLIKDCIKDCINVIEKRVNDSETMIDDMILYKINKVLKFIKLKI